MNIQKELDNLIIKYDICKPYSKYRTYVAIIDFLGHLIEDGNPIIIGTADDVKWVDQHFVINKSVIFEGQGFSSFPKLGSKENRFLYVSKEYCDQARVLFYERNYSVDYLYDLLADRGIEVSAPFYDVFEMGYHDYHTGEASSKWKDFDINEVFFYHRRNYEIANCRSKQIEYLEKIIFDTVFAKDFYTLDQYVEHYIKIANNEGKERINGFINELKRLVDAIKIGLRKRTEIDVFMFWLDAIEYGEESSVSFLEKNKGNSLVLENIYTVTPYTGPTARTIFCKSRTIEEKGCLIERITRENSELIQFLENNNYAFRYFGSKKSYYDKEYLGLNDYNQFTPMSQLVWDSLCFILESEKPCFCVIHEIFHTHIPFVSFGLMGKEYYYKEVFRGNQQITFSQQIGQKKESAEYLSNQLSYWSELIPENAISIYMSDHGHSELGRFHPICLFKSKSIRHKRDYILRSYYDFDLILKDIMMHGDIRERKNDGYVIIQDVDYYNEETITSRIQRFLEGDDDKLYLDPLVGYQGVVTETDLLIHFNNDIEYYLKHNNDEVIYEDSRIEYLRGLISKKRVDIYSEEKFKYARIVADGIKACKKRNKNIEETKRKTLEKAFDNVSDGELLAIRGGGMHTYRLIQMLSEINRKKITCIVDNNKNCLAGRLGVRVITPEEAAGSKWDIVIISSYDFKEEWIIEAMSWDVKTIIDIYELLKQVGINCNKEFYKLDFAREDFA